MSFVQRVLDAIAAIGADIKALNAKTTGGSNVPIGYTETKREIYKASIANAVIGQPHSLWRATGIPAQAAIPGVTPVVCNSTTLGAIDTLPWGLPNTYQSTFGASVQLAGLWLTLRDRLVHMGGLSGASATAQAVAIDLAASAVPWGRIGKTDYTEVDWFIEWYTDTGATAVTATVAVTYSDATTGTLSVPFVASMRAGRLEYLNRYIPVAKAGLGITAVNSITLSVSTGVAGNFGVTATRRISSWGAKGVYFSDPIQFTAETMPDVNNDACLMFSVVSPTTSTGVVIAQLDFIHGA